MQEFCTYKGRTLAITQARVRVVGEQLCFEDSHRQQAKHEPTACPGSKGGPQYPELHLQEQSQYIIGSGYCPLLGTRIISQ